jgi:hypothetical protein
VIGVFIGCLHRERTLLVAVEPACEHIGEKRAAEFHIDQGVGDSG